MKSIGSTGLAYLWEKIKSYISGLGFYTKPSTGIPATDIASGVIPTVPTALSAFTDDLGSNPTHTHSQYLTSHQDISGKANSADVYTKSEVDDMVEDVVYLGDAVGNETTADFNSQTDTVWNKAQVLGSTQQATARSNINAQETLVSGTNIKTINNESILGSGNITIAGGGGSGETNVIESISINGTAQTVTSKNVDLAVPVSSAITAIVTLTEAQYTALATKDSSTLYIITA